MRETDNDVLDLQRRVAATKDMLSISRSINEIISNEGLRILKWKKEKMKVDNDDARARVTFHIINFFHSCFMEVCRSGKMSFQSFV